ncbi:MAG: hypothetical protein GX347_08230, partial [Epulopiscium sp.]|nr:hypothetical protein [Candidatus Epulonipiscium sp.]
MSSRKSKQPKQRKKSLGLKFFGIVFFIVFTFLLVAGGATLGYLYMIKDDNNIVKNEPED